MLGEVTMVQFYSVALTAGKAHKDHKHHHVHHYDHNGQAITTPAPPTPAPRTNQPTHPLLTAGQINPNLRINLANPPQPVMVPVQLTNGQAYNAQLLNGQFVGNLVSQQLLGSSAQASQLLGGSAQASQLLGGSAQASQLLGASAQSAQQPRANFGQSVLQIQGYSQDLAPQTFLKSSQISDTLQTQSALPNGLVHSSLVNPANVQFIDSTVADHQLFKRNNKEGTKTVAKRQVEADRRALVLAGDTFIDDGLSYDQDYLAGLATYVGNQPVIKQQQSDEREPAEAEVMAVMKICGGCDDEPFSKALVFGWRTVAKKLYSGAIYAPAIPQCKVF